jgi:hypothetical protein
MMDINMITDGAIVNAGIVYSTIPDDSPRKFHTSGVVPDIDNSGEIYIPNIFRFKNRAD